MLEEDGLIQAAASDITQFCAENAILWAQFLEVVLRQPKVHLHLAIEHHNHRVLHNTFICSEYVLFVSFHSSLSQVLNNIYILSLYVCLSALTHLYIRCCPGQ